MILDCVFVGTEKGGKSEGMGTPKGNDDKGASVDVCKDVGMNDDEDDANDAAADVAVGTRVGDTLVMAELDFVADIAVVIALVVAVLLAEEAEAEAEAEEEEASEEEEEEEDDDDDGKLLVLITLIFLSPRDIPLNRAAAVACASDSKMILQMRISLFPVKFRDTIGPHILNKSLR
jgi:hypothetical protein